MYVCMYVCMHVCMYACMHACMHAWMDVCMYVYVHPDMTLYHIFIYKPCAVPATISVNPTTLKATRYKYQGFTFKISRFMVCGLNDEVERFIRL